MFRRIATIFVTAVIGFSFAACGADAGEIYGMQYEPARDWTTVEADYQYLCNYDYFKGETVCKHQFAGYKDVHHHEDECYRIKFRNESGDKGEACVTESEFNELEPGDWYDKNA